MTFDGTHMDTPVYNHDEIMHSFSVCLHVNLSMVSLCKPFTYITYKNIND